MNQHEKITELIQRLGKGEPFDPIDVADVLDWLRELRDNSVPKARLQETERLLGEAYDHLEWCGYGDEYEREVAKEHRLPERLAAYFQGNPRG